MFELRGHSSSFVISSTSFTGIVELEHYATPRKGANSLRGFLGLWDVVLYLF